MNGYHAPRLCTCSGLSSSVAQLTHIQKVLKQDAVADDWGVEMKSQDSDGEDTLWGFGGVPSAVCTEFVYWFLNTLGFRSSEGAFHLV